MVPREPIYKGATRPAMRFGIPLAPLVVLIGSGALLMLWGGVLLSGWIAVAVLVSIVPALIWMNLVTRRDDQRFHQIFVGWKLRLHDRNQRFWCARSYTPALLKGGRDGLPA